MEPSRYNDFLTDAERRKLEFAHAQGLSIPSWEGRSATVGTPVIPEEGRAHFPKGDGTFVCAALPCVPRSDEEETA